MKCFLQVRRWPARCLGVLKLVCQGKARFVAEVLDSKHLPSGRTIPESTGVWLSVLGSTDIVKKTPGMRTCVSFTARGGDVVPDAISVTWQLTLPNCSLIPPSSPGLFVAPSVFLDLMQMYCAVRVCHVIEGYHCYSAHHSTQCLIYMQPAHSVDFGNLAFLDRGGI
jgi:hypothetical protein